MRPHRDPSRRALVRKLDELAAVDVHRHPGQGRHGTPGPAGSVCEARRRCGCGDRHRNAWDNLEWEAYDEGRVAERILVAAGALGLGAAIGWADDDERPAVAEFLGVTAPHYVRTIVSIGHPTERARQPRLAPGTAGGRSTN